MRLSQTTAIAAAAALVAVALAVAAPSSSIRPGVSGNFKVGQKLVADSGTWAGSGTLAYAYQWYRCDARGSHCKTIRGAAADSYALTAGDGGQTIGLTVRATDTTGAAAAYASLAGPIASGNVYATGPPKLTGSAVAGQELKSDVGAWAVTPQAVSYQWLRCNRNGRICSPIAGATAASYKATAADVTHALVAQVTAKVGSTAQAALSAATAAVSAEGEGLPSGAPRRQVLGPGRKRLAAGAARRCWDLARAALDAEGEGDRHARLRRPGRARDDCRALRLCWTG
jgi:hypothetical protein